MRGSVRRLTHPSPHPRTPSKKCDLPHSIVNPYTLISDHIFVSPSRASIVLGKVATDGTCTCPAGSIPVSAEEQKLLANPTTQGQGITQLR